jgi:hypothetical protein
VGLQLIALSVGICFIISVAIALCLLTVDYLHCETPVFSPSLAVS